MFKAREHRWFQDKKFFEQLKKVDSDAVIWFTPYKLMDRDGFDYPDVLVINPKLINDDTLVEYDVTKMVDATRVKMVFPENL